MDACAASNNLIVISLAANKFPEGMQRARANRPWRTTLRSVRADKGHRIDSLLRAVVVWSFLFRALSPSAQTSPATLPNIQISSAGRVNAIVVQEGGKVIIGGDFSSVNGVPRQNIARINANGSVDETWNPG